MFHSFYLNKKSLTCEAKEKKLLNIMFLNKNEKFRALKRVIFRPLENQVRLVVKIVFTSKYQLNSNLTDSRKLVNRHFLPATSGLKNHYCLFGFMSPYNKQTILLFIAS